MKSTNMLGLVAVGLAFLLGTGAGKSDSLKNLMYNASQKLGSVKDTVRGAKERSKQELNNITISIKRPYGSGHIDPDDPEVIRKESRQEYGHTGTYGYVKTNPDR